MRKNEITKIKSAIYLYSGSSLKAKILNVDNRRKTIKFRNVIK